MGTYLNPPETVRDIGRRIDGDSYDALCRQLGPDDVLVGLFDRGTFRLAPHIYSPQEFDEFHKQCALGRLLREEFYAVPETAALLATGTAGLRPQQRSR